LGVEKPKHPNEILILAMFINMSQAVLTIVISIVHRHTFQEVAESVKEDFGSIDILVHSLANGPEVR
jgi:enoyl-[acyl-carrier-protein] reductase (NADH)